MCDDEEYVEWADCQVYSLGYGGDCKSECEKNIV